MSLLISVQNSLKRYELSAPLRAIAFGAGIAFALQLFGKVIGYLLQIVLARWMGPAEYGLFNYVLAWVAVLAMVGGMGFPEAILRFVPEYRTTKEWGYLRGVVIRSQQFTLVVSTLLGVLFVVVALWFNKRAGTTNEWLIYSGGLLVPIFASFNLIAETFRAFHKISVAYAPRQILEPLLLIGAVLGLTLLPGVTGIRSTEVLIADLFIFLLLLSLQWSLLRRLIRSIIEPAANGSAVTQQTTNTRPQAPQFNNRLWLNTSLPMLLVAGYRIILNRSDILLLGMFMATTDLGIYSAALIIAGTVSFVLVSVNSIFAPTVAAIYKKGDLTELQKLVSTTAHWSFWPSVALGLFLVFFAEPLLGLLGREFRAGRWELLILIGGNLINAGVGSVGYLLNMTGNQKYSAKVFGWTSLLSVLLYIGLIYFFGTIGAAIASSVTLAIRNLWMYHYVVTRLRIYPSVIDALRFTNHSTSA